MADITFFTRKHEASRNMSFITFEIYTSFTSHWKEIDSQNKAVYISTTSDTFDMCYPRNNITKNVIYLIYIQHIQLG